MTFQEIFAQICVILLIAGGATGLVFIIRHNVIQADEREAELKRKREASEGRMGYLLDNAITKKDKVIALAYAAENGWLPESEGREYVELAARYRAGSRRF